jgi:hypothetical protein
MINNAAREGTLANCQSVGLEIDCPQILGTSKPVPFSAGGFNIVNYVPVTTNED